MSDAAHTYGRFARPRLVRLLEACRLDVVYHRASGNSLWTRDLGRDETEVLDMVGGFGVGLLGHNHPRLVEEVTAALREKVPFHAQGSIRSGAGSLCEKLSELVGDSTGRRYVVTLANTGTEAVEAAIKHAELERDAKVRGILEGYREHHRSIQEKLRNRECDLVPKIMARLGERFGLSPGSDPDLDEIHHYVLRHNERLAEAEPLYLALERAFHGKTSGSLKMTYDHEVRHPFRRIGLNVAFLPVGDAAALEEAIQRATLTYLDLSIGPDGAVVLEEHPFINVAAFFVEPIQGEGGIRELPRDYLHRVRQVANEAGFPLVIDEIQSGCGRTGAFLASEHQGVVGDYYVLSKALGGGMVKISACLVDSARYRERFGSVHTSTFAEDELSSRVSLTALQLVTDPKYGTLERVRQQGQRLQDALNEVRGRYPQILVDVRGRGLMIGIEFARLDGSDSPTIRLMSSQGFLGFSVAGFLLHESRIRVLPTLSNAETLRIQPSAFITDDEIQRFADAVEQVCELLDRERGDRMIRFLCAEAGKPLLPSDPSTIAPALGARAMPRLRPTRPKRLTSIPPYAGRVSFLGHFIRPGHMRHWDPGLADYTDADLGRFVTRTHRLLEPYVSESAIIESVIGERVHMSFIGIPLTPHQIHRAFEQGNIRWVEEKILAGVRLARRQGASIVGMGGYTSILTGQGTRISEDRVGITSGNAMTVAMGVEALVRTAEELGIDMAKARLGALGATGNICSLYAQMMAERVPRMMLVGRPHMESRLRRVAGEVYFESYKLLRRNPDKALGGLAGILRGTQTFKQVTSAEQDLERIGTSIYNWISNEMGDEAPIQICSDPMGLKDCDLIVAASSTPDPLIYPKHLGEGPRVICDLALPEDTAPEVFEQRPDVKVIRGGIVKLPGNTDLELAGMPLEPGCVFACMAETLLLGLSRINEHFSWGRVTKLHVEAIRDLAAYHGFKLSRPSMTSVL